MPTPQAVYGALASWTAANITDLVGVWVADEPEGVEFPYSVIEDKGYSEDWQFQSIYIATGDMTWHVFTLDGDQVNTLADEIRALYGPAESQRDIPTDGTFNIIEVTVGRFQLFVEPDPSNPGIRVYRMEIGARVKISGSY